MSTAPLHVDAVSANRDACDHRFRYEGLRYCDGRNSLPGSSARRRYYAHVYFCERCLTKRSEPVHVDDSSFGAPKFGATPGSAEEVGVPSYDRYGR